MKPYKKITNESLENGDLNRLVDPRVTIDEYKSKMGTDEEIVVISFRVHGKSPSLDLVNFFEKSYEEIIDADVSSGEVFDDLYIVFVELERNPEIHGLIIQMFDDLENLTDVDEWDVEYFKPRKKISLDIESLKSVIPSTPTEYKNATKKIKDDIDQLKIASGVKVDTVAPKNEFTEAIRTAAGII
jgi:hypothetical protein